MSGLRTDQILLEKKNQKIGDYHQSKKKRKVEAIGEANKAGQGAAEKSEQPH